MRPFPYKDQAKTLFDKLQNIHIEVGDLNDLPTEYTSYANQKRYRMDLDILDLWIQPELGLIMILLDRDSQSKFENIWIGSAIASHILFNRGLLILPISALNICDEKLFVTFMMLYKNIVNRGKVAEISDLLHILDMVTFMRRVEKAETYGTLSQTMDKWIEYKPELKCYLPRLIQPTGTRRPNLITQIRDRLDIARNLLGRGFAAVIVDYKLVLNVTDTMVYHRLIDSGLVTDLDRGQMVSLKKKDIFDPAIWFSDEGTHITHRELIAAIGYSLPKELCFYENLDRFQQALEQGTSTSAVDENVKEALLGELHSLKELFEQVGSKINYIENRIREL